jgi:hypothetical protein
MHELKEVTSVAVNLAFLFSLLSFCVHIFFSWRNDLRRHREVDAFIDLFRQQNDKLINTIGAAFAGLKNQKCLIITRNEEGRLTIRALRVSEENAVIEELNEQKLANDEPDSDPDA